MKFKNEIKTPSSFVCRRHTSGNICVFMCLGVSSWRVFAPHFYAILRNSVDISLHNKIFQLQKKWFLKVEILNITKELNNDKI